MQQLIININQLAKYQSPDTPKGWFFPANYRKAHYFLGIESVCGKVLLFRPDLDDNNHNSTDNCAKCREIRQNIEAAIAWLQKGKQHE